MIYQLRLTFLWLANGNQSTDVFTLLDLIHLYPSSILHSIWYPVIGEPPSDFGGMYFKRQVFRTILIITGAPGFPGGSGNSKS